MVWQRIHEGLRKSSHALGEKISRFFGASPLSDEEWQDLEDELVMWDMGAVLSHTVCAFLRKQRIAPPYAESVRRVLAVYLGQLLAPYQRRLSPPTSLPQGVPWVVLVVGSNGCGKTTTLGKLGYMWSQQGYKVRLAAADTFRAAAAQQLALWGEHSHVALTLGAPQEDPASVVFRALQEAQDDTIVLIDTAGRLSNKHSLLEELSKIHRTIQRYHPLYQTGEAYERLLVLDATTGGHMLPQVEAFQKSLPLTGLVLNKIDGTAKGGMIFAVTQASQVPVVALGTGEKAEDLCPFEASTFVEALVS